jgi:hypothetical protein
MYWDVRYDRGISLVFRRLPHHKGGYNMGARVMFCSLAEFRLETYTLLE